ncbi:U2 small nuclear ribonucleoprotein B [Heterostelium album PN500]|uniref:U2 small nuclear ribonucleoprotein B n=1 Tax=Heterostelium pallidum (strain ATCC 26659 / Pp 5 / PN500) TaxID=670386 RepID=D3BQD0_HETP5|nr:U2 small nuclear ribonucleoprotein B [Heterostelium album PN500]EFA76350.1 U2 small nuclear ribonucleoprotein B [Heterostelium album PN500]|eukprot:XP_020428482.1 U2 small nuclear ribonucleoprotein B [Heterostelium album PN500]
MADVKENEPDMPNGGEKEETQSSENTMNQTIYVNNLNEKPSKKKLTEQLYSLFSPYGSILEIVAAKRQKMRGQAFIVFKDITSASNALREMNGFEFLGRPMSIQYAKSKSDAVSKLDGTYIEKKRERENDQDKKKAKKQQTKKPSTTAKPKAASTANAQAAPLQPREAPPNKILFVENLPEQCEEMMLNMLFSQFPGFQGISMTTAKKGVAFVEFDDDSKSAVAMTHLQGFKVTPEKPMVISFAAQ